MGQDAVTIHDNSDNPLLRPQLQRQDTSQLLSYYLSPDADGGFNHTPITPVKSAQSPTTTHHNRQLSVTSTSSSEYSTESSASEYSHNDSPVARRTKPPSAGASDRRRLAIVEVQDNVPKSKSTHTPHTASDLRSRRTGNSSLNGLALVVPPDAVTRLVSYSTPSTAPATHSPHEYRDMHEERPRQEKGHHRAASDLSGKQARNVAIVGTGPTPPPRIVTSQATEDTSLSTRPPLFMLPQSRSPSPLPSARPELALDRIPTYKRQLSDQSVITPAIGQNKQISDPVAPPVVMALANSRTLTPPDSHPRPGTHLPSLTTTSFANYQPGVHSTAGPLPPPPRATFSIDSHIPVPPRPPRSSPTPKPHDLDSVRMALQLPPSVSAALAKRQQQQQDSSPAVNPSRLDSRHLREGAFGPSISSPVSPPTTAIVPPTPLSAVQESFGLHSLEHGHAIAGESAEPALVIKDDIRELTSSPEGRRSSEMSLSPRSSLSIAPSPPPKSPPTNLRHSLTKGFRRMSLSRSSSRRSLSKSSSHGHQSESRTRSPSPSPPAVPSVPPVAQPSAPQVVQHAERPTFALPAVPRPRPPVKKIKTLYPAAMYCHEVQSQRSTLERCQIYAQKINELYICDCGLEDWVTGTLSRVAAGNGQRSKENLVPAPNLPSITQFSPQPRHTSGGSMFSEVTFPSRPDATSATDLAAKAGSSANAMPALPYPAMALATKKSAPLSLLKSNTSPSKTSGFFASLGRKGSISKKPQPPLPLAVAGRLTKNPPPPPRAFVPVPVINPSVPGGPRGPGSRMARSHSIMPSPSPSFSGSNKPDNRRSAVHRRPSLSASANDHSHSNSSGGRNASPTPDFNSQVDKLSHLLPHADRDILAAYLRRAGQDILAIGQYLEDEKAGTLRRD